MADFVDDETRCEFAQSQWVKDVPGKYPGAFKGIGTGLGVEV